MTQSPAYKKGLVNLKKYLNRYDKFIISTHESPDADGLGSEIAFLELLRFLGKTALIINSDPVPETVEFIDVDREIKVLRQNFRLPSHPEQYAHFILDTRDYDNIGILHSTLKNIVRDVFIIDHHEGENTASDRAMILSDASSCSEIICDLIKSFGMKQNLKTAQALFAGMVFDTGSFRYPKTTPHTYRIAADCIENGASPSLIYENLYERNSLSSFSLRNRIASSMEIMEDGKLVVQKLTPEMLTETGATFTEGETSINTPLTVKGVIASVLIKQDYTGPVKVSMRTKGPYDVAKIAIANSGGGHKNAAGYKSNLPFDEAYRHAVQEIKELLRNGN